MPLIYQYGGNTRMYVGFSVVILLLGYRILPWTNFFIYIFGFLSSLAAIWYTIQNQVESPTKARIVPKFKFMDEWKDQLAQIYPDESSLHKPVIRESLAISKTINEFFDLVIGEFVTAWFEKVSSNRAFTANIKLELNHVVKNVKIRLQTVNFSKLLVSKLLPIIDTHFHNFLKAEHRLASNSDTQLALAHLFPLHSGVTINMLEKQDNREKIYLRERIRSILPYLLSENEKYNDLTVNFVTEVLGCTILVNVFNLIAESDFYNVLIIKLIGDNLKHRDQVKQLRAALEEYTGSVSKKVSMRSLRTDRELIDATAIFTITDNLDDIAFKEICKTIDDISAIDELMLVKRSILVQLNNVSFSSNSERGKLKRMKRLQLLKTIVCEKLDKINGSAPQNYKLLDILVTHVDSFALFMKYRKRDALLLFWKDVELIKVPLENDTLTISLEFSTLQDLNNISQNYFHTKLIPITSDVESVFEGLQSNPDIDTYQRCRSLLFKIQHDIYNEMESLDLPLFVISSYFSRVPSTTKNRKQSMLLLDSVDIHVTDVTDIEHDDDVSPEVVQAVEDAFTEIMKNPTGANKLLFDELPSSSLRKEPSSSEISLRENIRNSLLFDEGDSDDRLFEDSSGLSSRLEGNSRFSQSLEDITDKNAKTYENRYSKLFDAESLSDTDSINSDSPLIDSVDLEETTEGSQVFLAAPGDLSLAEQISILSQEIEKLNNQLSVLEPLLKKASLTNNIAELKILKKSKVSLEREIKYKELQMHQYIVQENDNSLYGKSRVSIQSYVVGNDEKQNGREFILYIIEVQKFGEDADLITAGWIVARRFSQFFKLNEYLRMKYSQVNLIKFPKRTVLKPQRQLVEARKSQLEEYLKQLIEIPEVCSDKIFRSFLSSENFDLTNNFEKNSSNANAEMIMKKIYNITEKFAPKPSQENTIQDLRDMQKELKQFDDSSKPIFVKPICDLLITIFKLSKSQSWLRGRALLVILQQIFGTTIEKMVYQQVDNRLHDETVILDLLTMLKNTVFPNGKFKDPPILRTAYERSTSKKEARVLLAVFINETCSKIFGSSNSNYASLKLFSMIQNDYLNKHLLFTIFDEIIAELFPEIA